jgi:Domain of Unknown Function (DUF1080)
MIDRSLAFQGPMKRFFATLALSSAVSLASADDSLLAVPGKVLFDSKLDSALAAPAKAVKGSWEPADGVIKGAELASDKHGAVMRLATVMTDFTMEVELKLDGARMTSMSINSAKGHVARLSVSPTMITVQKDDSDHEGPDKAVIFHRVKTEVKVGEWHKLRIEIVGDTMLGQVDGIVGYGTDAMLTQPKANPGLTVGGQSAQFRNLRITEATKNPKWDEIKATIVNKVDPVAAPGAKGKGKGKAKAKAAAN